jgi:predicted Zn-dependent protease
MLHFSREHEREADQRAIMSLHNANLSVKGMVEMFEKLRLDSQLSFGSLPPYLLTHPLPEDRLQSLERVAAAENTPPPVLGDPAFARILAKVYALSHTPGETMRHYPGTDEPSQYARAIALGLQGKLKEAGEALAPLLKAHPDDPFYIELKAQLALDGGDLPAAETLMAKVVQLKPRLILPRFQLAEIQRNRDELKPALGNLLQVTRDWPVWASPWESLGIVYGQLGQLAMSHLCLAQAALYSDDEKEARQQLNIAKHYLKGDAPDAPRAASGTVPLPKVAGKDTEAQGWADALEERLKGVR